MPRKNARHALAHTTEIVAASFAYPSDVVDNAEYMRRAEFTLSSDVETLAAESGIQARRWCRPDENTRTLAHTAVARLMAAEPERCRGIDLVVVASGTTLPIAHPADQAEPASADLAPLVLEWLGQNRGLGLDIKACYCSGFLRGIQVVDGLLANSNYRRALLIAAEQGSRYATAASNRSAFCFIVADAAGAVLLERSEGRPRAGIVDYCGYTDVSKRTWVGIGDDARSMIMLGSRAATATKEMLVECARDLLGRNGLTPAHVDWLIPIQTHRGLLAEVCRALEWPSEKLLWTAERTGFSGSASIPCCLAEQRANGTLKPGQLVLSLAVGAGMNCAGALYRV